MPNNNPTGKGGFLPGKSGNPSGRPKRLAEFREACRDYAGKALDGIVAMVVADDTPKAVAMNGLQFIIEQAWGRATQPHSGDEERPPVAGPDLSKLSTDELRKYREFMARAYAAGSGQGTSDPPSP